jgi:hypothetical protein
VKHGRTDPVLWERCKREAVRRLGGRHSARAMQLAGHLYRKHGGGYLGGKTTAQRRLSKWTAEKWTTYTGDKARKVRGGKVVYDRYLPAAAWKMLTPAEIRATRKKKLAARSQYVPNTAAAKKAGAKARKARRQGKA